jgi:hypothetical protein
MAGGNFRRKQRDRSDGMLPLSDTTTGSVRESGVMGPVSEMLLLARALGR